MSRYLQKTAIATLVMWQQQHCLGLLIQPRGVAVPGWNVMPRSFRLSAGKEGETQERSVTRNEENGAVVDEFAHLVESHPLDDPEPSFPRQRRLPLKSQPNPYNIPTTPEKEWGWFYSKLKARYQAQQDDKISSRHNTNMIEESLLRHWMAQQRKSFMKTLGVLDLSDRANWGTDFLSKERKEALDAVGFQWGHLQPLSLTNDFIYSDDFQRRVRLKYKDWMWNDDYEKLVSFVDQHGHTRVPLVGDTSELGAWAAEQRKLRWDIPERRRQRLDDIQFDWDYSGIDNESDGKATSLEVQPQQEDAPLDHKEVSFARRLTELKDYRKTHGDCNVPLDREDGLGMWVQRMRGRRATLSPSSIRKLETIGLEFTEKEEEQ